MDSKLRAAKTVSTFRNLIPLKLRNFVHKKINRIAAPQLQESSELKPATINSDSKLHLAHLEIGQLKAELQAANYWWTLFKWRYKSMCVEHFGPPDPTNTPPTSIPENLVPEFTMGGRIPIEYVQYDNQTRPKNYTIFYTDDEIDSYLEMLRAKKWFIYGMTDYWLWEAFTKYSIQSKSICVMGSTTPWYESTCIYYGGLPTTIEYNTIVTKSKRMRALTVEEFNNKPELFDCAVSISSFEHDGLGLYGDPIDPIGDFKAMAKMKEIIRPGGLLYLSVPVGRDRIQFNNARIYGNIRFPELIKGWDVVDSFGFDDGVMTAEGGTQPIIVLRNN
jgi:hypothetical protein